MILPATYGALLLILIFGMLAWGTWANTLKASGEKWRFELYSIDFAIGVLIAAAICALTWGNLGFDGFSFLDDLRLAGKRQELFAFGAGGIFNLGNMLLMGSLTLVGMSVAFPVAMGFGLVVAVCWNFALNPGGNAVVSFTGALVVFGAAVAGILAYRANAADQIKAKPVEPGKTKPKKARIDSKGITLGFAGGLALGSFGALLQMAETGENGLGPYTAGFMFAVGIFFSTFVFNLFFMNLPVKGEPIDVSEYFRGKGSSHGMGLLGGILWYAGTIASLLGTRTEGTAKITPSITFALSQSGILIAVICGLLIWKEFADSDSRVKTYLGLMLALLVIGIGLVSSVAIVPSFN